ncbi:unnamed protein product [Strongylus vulgaris]|uniref:Uncharacterized protein n=1 Tax=Strongylus vulgaris TaxID=40348 RepID=A0A3P7I2L1_STRVU|nr:unnamed protein product [Strongylus vulgaris]
MCAEDAISWIDLIEKSILERPFSSTPGSYPSLLLKSLALLLFWPDWQVRKRASLTVERILIIEESHFAEALADVIFTESISGIIDQTLRKVRTNHSDPSTFTIPGEWYVQVLRLLLMPKGPELEKLAIHTLLLASVPRLGWNFCFLALVTTIIDAILVEVDGSVWLRWVHSQADSNHWKESEMFRKTAIDRVLQCPDRKVRDNALITLVALNVPSVRSALWAHIENSINDLDVNEYVRIPERNVAIFHCQEGHLYNTEVFIGFAFVIACYIVLNPVLPLSFSDEGEITYNMKRENKAYSFRDQLAEMHLRRELAEKKRKEGKLTAAQKQVMEKELAKEKEIRIEMRHMYDTAEVKLDEARAMVAADNQGAFARWVGHSAKYGLLHQQDNVRPELLFNFCIPLTRSHLVSKEAAQLFLAYRDIAFPHTEDYLDELLGSTILRVIGSHWRIADWAEEPLPSALDRSLQLLNERAFVVETGDDVSAKCKYIDMSCNS